MIRSREAGLVPAALLLLASAAVSGAPEPRPRLLAVTPTSPWTLVELERSRVEIASYDPQTGVAYVIAGPAEEARLVDAGFRVATADPDLESGRRALAGAPDLGLYHTYAETVAELESLATANPDVCRLVSLGPSLEGRPIPALEISDDPDLEDPTEPEVLVVGCHHAREFMSVEVPLHFARTLLAGRTTQPQLAALVATRQLWIVPMLNVDGHVYQESLQASPEWMPPGWRKNRRPNLDGSFGVDLNRNYGYMWGYDDEGSSPEPSDETYRGTGPFSEPETQVLRAFIERHRFVITISYHSYGRVLLYPWGYTRSELPEDAALFAALADSMVLANGYRPGNAYYGTIYRTNGEFCDWVYGELAPRKPYRGLPFTVELNSVSEGGFWPPEWRIGPTCDSMWPLNLYALRVADNPRRPLPPPPPLVTGTQDVADGRRIRLEWNQPVDPANPVDHWEVFEIVSGASGPAAAGELEQSGRVVLARDVARPAGGSLALRLRSELAPLWDYAYIEARVPGGNWVALAGDPTRDESPTGRNAGHGWTGPIADRTCRFRLDGVAGPRLDLALRLDLHPESARPARARAVLDLAATYVDERRVLDPDVREPHYELVAEKPGIVAYGVTAVDADGQRTDSELHFFVIPTTAVRTSDVHVERAGDRIVLRWRNEGDGPARFEAWTRELQAGEAPGDAGSEWARGDYALAAAGEFETGIDARLEWRAASPSVAVLLRGQDADGERLWGPLVAERQWGGRFLAPVANPYIPGSALALDLPAAARVRVEVCSVDGRVARRLADARLGSGVHALSWDGRDAAGRRVASGVYLLRVVVDGRPETRRLVILH